tara:strand:+ start:1292 stop:1465 length:174 start_codon:yes stop_codon:yes gene_type:complete
LEDFEVEDEGVVDFFVGDRDRDEAESSLSLSEVFLEDFLGDLEKKFIGIIAPADGVE